MQFTKSKIIQLTILGVGLIMMIIGIIRENLVGYGGILILYPVFVFVKDLLENIKTETKNQEQQGTQNFLVITRS